MQVAPDEDIAIPDFLKRTEPDMARKKKSNGEAPAETQDEQRAEAQAEAGAADLAENGIGHNQPPAGLTDDQRQALFFQHLKQVRALKEKIASTTGELRAAYKL